jgi:hypothetical protein
VVGACKQSVNGQGSEIERWWRFLYRGNVMVIEEVSEIMMKTKELTKTTERCLGYCELSFSSV